MLCPSAPQSPAEVARVARPRRLRKPTPTGDAVNDAVGRAVMKFQELVRAAIQDGVPADAAAMLDFEHELHQKVARECLDPVTAAVLQTAAEEDAVLQSAAVLVASYQYLRLQKRGQVVNVTLLGGSEVEVVTDYYLVRPPKRAGKKRRKGQRGKDGSGVYPALAVLGVHYRVSPALASEVGTLIDKRW